jgi:hypothetical protein
MPLDLPSTNDLASIYGSWNPNTYMQAADQLPMRNKYAQGQLTAQQQDNDLAAQMNPLKVQRSGLDNLSLGMQIPGQAAQSDMLMRKNSNEASVNDSHIQSVLSSYKSQLTKDHVDQMGNVGSAMLGMAENVWSNPVGSAQRAKSQFDKLGIGDMWNPKWDTLPPDQLAMQLSEAGKGIRGAVPKLYDALATAGAKGDAALGVQGLRNEGSANVAQIAADAKLAAARLKAELQPKKAETMSQYEARITQAAHSEDPEEAKQGAMALADLYKQQINKASASANVGDTLKRDVLGLPNDTVPNAPAQADQKVFQQAWPGEYDPKGYEYRMGPNGKPQRRKKS